MNRSNANHIARGFTSIGVFADFGLPSDEDIKFTADHGFDTLVIGVPIVDMIGTANFKLTCKEARIEERIKAVKQANLTAILMTWLARSSPFIREACSLLGGMALQHGIWLLHDAEKDYHEGTGDKPSPDKATELVKSSTPDGVYWGVTGLDRLHPTLLSLASEAHFLIPQAYSFWKKNRDKHWSHSTNTFPGFQQVRAYNSWRKAGADKRIIMGNAGYDLDRPATGLQPALSQTQSAILAFGQTLALGVDESVIWSINNLQLGVNRETLSFFG